VFFDLLERRRGWAGSGCAGSGCGAGVAAGGGGAGAGAAGGGAAAAGGGSAAGGGAVGGAAGGGGAVGRFMAGGNGSSSGADWPTAAGTSAKRPAASTPALTRGREWGRIARHYQGMPLREMVRMQRFGVAGRRDIRPLPLAAGRGK